MILIITILIVIFLVKKNYKTQTTAVVKINNQNIKMIKTKKIKKALDEMMKKQNEKIKQQIEKNLK
jgi:hypothetical protein